MKVPIIILNYNTSFDCRKCISFLKKQQGIDIEIVVVDNCSSEDDLKNLRSLCEEVQCTLIENHENKGYNAGNNIGLRYAADKGYEYALIANPDMEFPQEDYLLKLTQKMQKDEDIVACSSDILHIEGFHQNPVLKDESWYHCFDWILLSVINKKHKYALTTGNYSESHYCSKLSGCCLMLRTSFIKDIGFFDEKVFLYCEEGILSKQIELKNKKCYYCADLQAIHNHKKSSKGDPKRSLSNWLQSRLYFEKTYNCSNLWQYAIVKFALYFRYSLISLKS